MKTNIVKTLVLGGLLALAGGLFFVNGDEPEAEELVCWTFVRPPMCSEARNSWTCCDHLSCYTFLAKPDCHKSGEVYVCCAE